MDLGPNVGVEFVNLELGFGISGFAARLPPSKVFLGPKVVPP